MRLRSQREHVSLEKRDEVTQKAPTPPLEQDRPLFVSDMSEVIEKLLDLVLEDSKAKEKSVDQRESTA